MKLEKQIALDEATIRYMTELFADASPKPTDSDREIWIRVGKREAAYRMLALLETQMKEQL